MGDGTFRKQLSLTLGDAVIERLVERAEDVALSGYLRVAMLCLFELPIPERVAPHVRGDPVHRGGRICVHVSPAVLARFRALDTPMRRSATFVKALTPELLGRVDEILLNRDRPTSEPKASP